MKKTIYLFATFIFGVLLLFGGSLAFYKTGSVPSLFAASLFALLLFVSCFGMYKRNQWGFVMASAVTGAIMVLFAFRASMTHKPIPIAIFSLSSALFILQRILSRR